MRRLLTFALTWALLIAALAPVSADPLESAGADGTTYGSATLQAGHPTSSVIGITEAEFKVKHCSSAIVSQGIDGFTIPVSRYLAVRASFLGVRLPSNMSFYSAGCEWKGTRYWRDTTPVESPLGSAWAVLSVVGGTQINLQWKTGQQDADCIF